MTDFQVAAILLTLTAALAYVNARVLRMPPAIGLMAMALLASLVGLALDATGVSDIGAQVTTLLDKVDLAYALLHGMLGILLFAGALHVNLGDLHAQRWPIAVLALVGTALSTAVVGGGAYLVFDLLGLPVPLIYCLLFGSLISPTDPIAVLGILKSAGAPHGLAVTITGESLFNDGVGVVIFLVLLGVAAGGEPDAVSIGQMFVQEAIGGAVFGLLVGYVGFRLLRSIEQYSVEILITLAMVFGGYAAAEALHLSAPITAVTSGLLIGNHGRTLAMSDSTREHLDTFWELIDEILNAVLFLLIGLEVVHLTLTADLALAAIVMIPLVLLARLIAVGVPAAIMPRFRRANPGAVAILTWGGLRGGISVALALSLPAGPERSTILVVTYAVVVFAILIQGLSLGRLIRRLTAPGSASPPA
ncbi:MAG: sodium:proton antiporter [Kofleriaceae bacterium]|nr:sodium:proton antiporter [Kofleriaceae bacterium]MCL4228655.1 sodium:proton antiporter [Myxococcales bacterium]